MGLVILYILTDVNVGICTTPQTYMENRDVTQSLLFDGDQD